MDQSAKMSKQEHFQKVKHYLAGKWSKSSRYREFIIDLTDKEVNDAKRVAQQRIDSHKKIGRRKGNIQRETLGALGEMATIKWFVDQGYDASFNKFFESNVSLDHEDEFDTDLVWNGEEVSVEIKATQKPMNSKLIVSKKQFEKKNAEVYVLVCQISESKYCIKGFASSGDLEKDPDLKYGAYSVNEKNLKINLEDLLNK